MPQEIGEPSTVSNNPESPIAPPDRRTSRKKHPALRIIGALVLVIIVLVLIWDWDWFIPIIDRKASVALNRPVSIAHLHVGLGLRTTVRVDNLKIGQPQDFRTENEDFASAKEIAVTVNVWRYVTGGGLSIPLIHVDTPKGDIVSLLDGRNNYTFGTPQKDAAPRKSSTTSIPNIGTLEINDADIRVALQKLRTDMHVLIHTTPAEGNRDGTIVVDLKGRYARAPITGHVVGGSLQTLTSRTHPYPIDGKLENGPTYVTLRGTVDDPIAFKGTNLALHFAGPDMALLYALTGVPIPHTPAYNVTGSLDYSANAIRFEHFEGRMGSSDIGGNIAVNPHQKPPFVDAALHSHYVNLNDLGGFIGARTGEAAKTAPPSKNILPDQKISVPKLNAVNAHLTYHGDRIINKDLPLDNIDTAIDIRDGAIDVHHLNFAIGDGKLASSATLQPAPDGLFKTDFKLDVSRMPLSRIMSKDSLFKGQGTIGGHVTLASTGNSVASLVGNGDGGVTLVLDRGGHLSALLPDLLGLKLGAAVLSAIGIPDRSKLECLVADLPLRRGVVHTNTLLLQTSTTRTTGSGTVDMRNDTLDYSVTTRAVHMQILSLPGAVNITGPLTSPTVLPGAELAGRAAAAVGLGILFPPAALLPTIQFGVGEGSACEKAVNEANTNPAAGIAPGSTTGNGASSVPHATVGTTPRHGKTRHLTPSQIHAAWQQKSHTHH